ncbi:TPA: addiction module toxin, HicA family [Candidatus Woesearchaeota archaeon]|nr:type II toxin-antitoxin system HicA family toxin [Candidatus Woesearchaeota archaeon]HIG93359.1 addiction module toxin, HicA family [Candidatus Woesearchaeota archaeon]
MPKLPVLSGIETIKILAKIGFVHIRTKGSHAILKKQTEEKSIILPVPLHKELAKGTLLSIIHQAGITREEFFQVAGK